jgi:creatinine amidohydrolase
MLSSEIADAVKRNALVIVPIGQTEEHGPHLPTGTDVMIGDEVANRIEEALESEMPVVVMDTVQYGYSVKAVSEWAGTIRLSPDTVGDVMRELCTSLCEMGFRKIAIVNAHGNHPAILEMVSRRLADECDVDVPVIDAGKLVGEALAKYGEGGEGASCHAGEMETSIMLRLRPDLVKTDRYPTGDRMRVKNPCSGAVFWSTWRRQKSRTGIYGDPATASAEKGEKFLDGIVQKACQFLRTYYAHRGLGARGVP